MGRPPDGCPSAHAPGHQIVRYFHNIVRPSSHSVKEKRITILGSVAYADFPDFGKKQVPCRVDTGAQTSSLHCTEVLVEGEARPGAPVRYKPLGCEDWIEGTICTIRMVKSSTGHKEQRVSIKTKITLGGRKINAEFTLTDRSGMNFQVLLGRKLLRGKFLVDVALKNPLPDTK